MRYKYTKQTVLVAKNQTKEGRFREEPGRHLIFKTVTVRMYTLSLYCAALLMIERSQMTFVAGYYFKR